MNTANGKPFEKNLDDVVDLYKDNLDKFQLKTQLSLLPVQFGRENGKASLNNIIKYLRNLTNAQKMFVPGDNCHEVALGCPGNQCCK